MVRHMVAVGDIQDIAAGGLHGSDQRDMAGDLVVGSILVDLVGRRRIVVDHTAVGRSLVEEDIVPVAAGSLGSLAVVEDYHIAVVRSRLAGRHRRRKSPERTC